MRSTAAAVHCMRSEIEDTTKSRGEFTHREIEKFIIGQPPMGEKDDYDSENSWIPPVAAEEGGEEVGGGR